MRGKTDISCKKPDNLLFNGEIVIGTTGTYYQIFRYDSNEDRDRIDKLFTRDFVRYAGRFYQKYMEKKLK